MDVYPPSMPSSLGAFYPTGHPPMMPALPQYFQARPPPLRTYSMESLGSQSDMDDPAFASSPQQTPHRPRRRHPPGSEHIKHRRTRSGCYTCRQRRVKCDETRPICDRCRKGKRECNYPGSTSSSTKPARHITRTKGSSAYDGSSASGDESDEEHNESLPINKDDAQDPAQDETEPQSATSNAHTFLDPSSLPTNTSISPSTSIRQSTTPELNRATPGQSAAFNITANRRWSSLSKEVKWLLKYFIDNLSHHHYGFKYDGANFLKTTFLEIAINDERHSLIYAIVAFAAYHYNLQRGDTRISHFLAYYNKSIQMLQQSLKNKKPRVTTILTILQLATIEEFLGDWVNLLGHQRAAHLILTSLFNPQTIMQDETSRQIIAWYIRFDLFAGMMSGNETSLSREWFLAYLEYSKEACRERPHYVRTAFDEYFATSRLLATDAANLMAARAKEAISLDQFVSQCVQLLQQFSNHRSHLETAFTDRRSYVKSLPDAPPANDSDITDYRAPNFLYSGELFPMNYVLLDFYTFELVFKCSFYKEQDLPSAPDMTETALKVCKIAEAVRYCDEALPGAILCCQTSLGAGSLFLPKDQKHIDWCRRMFALIEQLGYIYPAVLRERTSESWGVDVTQWWLPNNEGYPPVIRAIRDFIEYRARVPADAMDVQVRNMSGIFRGLQMNEDGVATDTNQFLPHGPRESLHGSRDRVWSH